MDDTIFQKLHQSTNLVEALLRQARRTCGDDDCEFMVSEWSSADAYDLGRSDGAVMFARKLLDYMGVQWKAKDS